MKVQFLKDKRIFTLFCWLNCCGYEEENNSQGMHTTRIWVRQYIRQKGVASTTDCDFTKRFHRSKLVQWVLHRSEPPGFNKNVTGWYGSIDETLFDNLENVLKKFYLDCDIESIWNDYQKDLDIELSKYKAINTELTEVIQRLRIINLPQEIKLIPNLLDAYWRGTGIKIDKTAYIIFGPSGELPNLQLIRHEFLHCVVDPALSKMMIKKDERFFKISENLIRGINVALEKNDQNRKELMEKEQQQGFEYIKHIAGEVRKFETNSPSPFGEEFLHGLITTIFPSEGN